MDYSNFLLGKLFARLLAAIVYAFQTFRYGNPHGNVPSPRTPSLTEEDVTYDSTTQLVQVAVMPPIRLTTVQNRNSMEPLIDVGHTVILSAHPLYLEDIKVGDIIVWTDSTGKETIHSVIETGEDVLGWYCRTQGLNVPRRDAQKVRRGDIRWVAVGVLWTQGVGTYREGEGD